MSARMFNNYQHRCLNCFESRTDLSEAIKETKAASQYVIQNKRNNMVWDALYTSTVEFFYINKSSKYNKMFFIDACTTAFTATPKH